MQKRMSHRQGKTMKPLLHNLYVRTTAFSHLLPLGKQRTPIDTFKRSHFAKPNQRRQRKCAITRGENKRETGCSDRTLLLRNFTTYLSHTTRLLISQSTYHLAGPVEFDASQRLCPHKSNPPPLAHSLNSPPSQHRIV